MPFFFFFQLTTWLYQCSVCALVHSALQNWAPKEVGIHQSPTRSPSGPKAPFTLTSIIQSTFKSSSHLKTKHIISSCGGIMVCCPLSAGIYCQSCVDRNMRLPAAASSIFNAGVVFFFFFFMGKWHNLDLTRSFALPFPSPPAFQILLLYFMLWITKPFFLFCFRIFFYNFFFHEEMLSSDLRSRSYDLSSTTLWFETFCHHYLECCGTMIFNFFKKKDFWINMDIYLKHLSTREKWPSSRLA